MSYNRYSILKNDNGTTQMSPFIKLPKNQSDKYEYWNANYSRLDKLSQKYYGSPIYGFFILYANPSFVSEFDIPDNQLIRIPFPFEKVKADYNAILANYMEK